MIATKTDYCFLTILIALALHIPIYPQTADRTDQRSRQVAADGQPTDGSEDGTEVSVDKASTDDVRPASKITERGPDDAVPLAEVDRDKSVQPKEEKSRGKWVIPDNSIEYGVELGFAPLFATWTSGTKYYRMDGRKHAYATFRWGRILGTRGFVTYSWAAEFTPINIAINNEVDNPSYTGPGGGEPPRLREETFGVVFNPASFRFTFFPKMRLRPQLGAGFGVSHHFKRVPTVEGTKMNFQIDWQLGAQYMLRQDRALNFGYKYYHLSNLYMFNFNPGYNMHMFYVGYSIFKK